MRQWSRLLKIVGTAAVVIAAITFFGQGCQNFGGSHSGGNGSGYGGLIPQPDGEYTPVPQFSGSRSGPDFYNDNYFSFGRSQMCSANVAALGEVGPYVMGRIFFNDSYFIQQGLCSPVQNLDINKINFVHFNQELFLVDSLIYELYKIPPQLLEEVRYPLAHCQALDSESGTHTGFVANVFERNGGYFAEILRGVRSGNRYFRFKVDELAITMRSTANQTTYEAVGFDLVVQNNGPAATGSMQLNWNGESINRPALCW